MWIPKDIGFMDYLSDVSDCRNIYVSKAETRQ